MERAGKSSWRFAEDIGQIPNALLFVRDSLRLTLDSEEVPTRLLGEIPDLTDHLDTNQRYEAAQQWPAWWGTVIAHEAEMHLGARGDDYSQWRHRLAEQLRAIVDPPEWLSLADRPGLQAAARASFSEGCRWADINRRSWLPPKRGPFFEWNQMREIADEVVTDFGVDAGDINGCAIVLLVGGIWYEVVLPGVVLCSVGAAGDPLVAEAILRWAFTSSIAH